MPISKFVYANLNINYLVLHLPPLHPSYTTWKSSCWNPWARYTLQYFPRYLVLLQHQPSGRCPIQPPRKYIWRLATNYSWKYSSIMPSSWSIPCGWRLKHAFYYQKRLFWRWMRIWLDQLLRAWIGLTNEILWMNCRWLLCLNNLLLNCRSGCASLYDLESIRLERKRSSVEAHHFLFEHQRECAQNNGYKFYVLFYRLFRWHLGVSIFYIYIQHE